MNFLVSLSSRVATFVARRFRLSHAPVRFAFAFCLLAIAASLSFAQNTNSGDIRGTVTDPSGAVVPEVAVTVANLDTGMTKHLVTNNEGLYDTASILPGKYLITFAKDGFEKLVRGPITVQVGIVTVNGELRVGAVSQEVRISENVALLKTETPEQSTTFDAETLVNLPQVSTNGQNWGSFANLLPGASGSPSQPTSSGKSGDPGIAVAVNGNLPFYSNFLQDGASTNLPISANVDIATFETISELQISTSSFSAQYGIGGVVFNQITKSGTNQWHGAAYEYFGADYLNAKPYNFSATPQPKQSLRYHNYGGSVGGPIFKDKLFFYFNTDKIVNHGQGNPGFATVPTAAMRLGDFTGMPTIYDPTTQLAGCKGAACVRTPFPNNKIPADRIDSVAKALQAYFPAPTPGVGTPSPKFPGLVTNNYRYLSPTTNPFLKFFGRIDYNVSTNHRVNFSITQGDNPGITTNQNNCPINCYSGDVDRYNAQVSDVYAFSPRTINEAHFGYTRQGNWFIPQTLNKGFPEKVGLQFAKADVFPQMNITGIGGLLTPGTNAIYIENQFEPSDIVTMIRGKHILHFGGELMAYQANYTPWGNVQSGVFGFTGAYTQQTPNDTTTGSGYADFLLGYANNWGANNQPESGMRMKSPQLFVQDDFKLRPNFTLNLGLRYERQGGWSEVQNHIGTFDPNLMNPATNTLGAMWFCCGSSRNSLQAPVNDIFMPRVGLAWSPRGNTVIRGGFGIYVFTWSLDTYGNGVGFGSNSSGNASDKTPNERPITILSGPGTNAQTGAPLPYLSASKSPSAYNGQNVNYNPYNTPVGTMKQWSFSVERQLGANMAAELAYVGSHGSNLNFPVNINQVPLSRLSATAGQADRPYAQFGDITGSTNNAISNYNAFQAQIQKRFSGGLSFNGNYTWSHFLDDQDSAGWGSRGGTQVHQNAYDHSANYGNSNFDQRHAVKGSVVYELPFGKGRTYLNNNSIVDAILGRWQTSATLVAHSGQPFTVTMASSNSRAFGGGSSPYGGSQFPNVIGDWHSSNPGILNWYNTAAFAQPAAGTFGNEGRNTLVGPRLSVINFSLGKNFKFTERLGVQLRVDAANILNHPSFGIPNCGGANCNPQISFDSTGTPTTVPTITTTTIGPRSFQLNARVSF
jgi:Carboxypeptidase regulatory-like domain